MDIQRRLGELRRVHISAAYVLGMSWWMLWFPFLIVSFRAAFGADLYAMNPSFALLMDDCKRHHGHAVGMNGHSAEVDAVVVTIAIAIGA